MKPSMLYAQACLAGHIEPDLQQRNVLPVLDQFIERVRKKTHWWQAKRLETQHHAAGIYLHGPVGRGKTYLMDLMVQCNPAPLIRLHFHAFMQRIHQQLKAHQGKENPLAHVAADWAKKYRLVCLDEFFVSDIADAMILKALLEAFLACGIYWVITSNTMPDNLYEHGLQRPKFLPAIGLINSAMRVLSVAGDRDHRRQFLTTHTPFFFEETPKSHAALVAWYQHLSQGLLPEPKTLRILDHDIFVEGAADTVVWGTFEALCQTPRNTADYLQLATQYRFWMVTAVPVLTEQNNAEVLRFIYLIDTLYDQQCRLVLQLKVPLEALYTGTAHQAIFQRTLSRLQEMQSVAYWDHS
ncbi:MAG: cell division protein ZapE [Pseudomonadota bacterium]